MSWKTAVKPNGYILLYHTGHYADQELTQLEAVLLAEDLLQAVRKSTDRNQKKNPDYYSTEAIEYRANSPLGKAISAVSKVFR